ncbi:PAS domain-containing hybrid sensor histidine kinase/response regulator [Ideonella sp. BN130291]|uniref:PAS domain-containing hybrid sensor histidine kinase/response regulator n=1 Tax=Ideonella sp. BN130291 TaxID=3112940 RepID=UPI002E275683|nr:PAS domain S-box protein [Ideonella sp. BN130291]
MPSDGNVRLASPATTLQHSEERFRLLVEAVEDYAIFLLDPNGIVTSWNPGAQKLKGYLPHEIIGKSFTEFYPKEVLAAGWPQEELRRATREGRFEDEGWRIRKDGSRFWANVVITALRDDNGGLYGFAKVTRDLTERRRHEENLRESEERFRLLVNSVRDYAIFMLDPEGHIESWNAGATALKGYAASEVLGRHFSIFYTAADLAAGKPARELEQAVREGGVHDEGWRVRKDGSLFWAGVTITPVYNAAGSLRGYAKVTRDMSERRRLADLEDSSRRMSEFLAMLAHELRNPLAPIRNAVSIMQLEKAVPPRVSACRDIIDRQLSHLTRLVDDLLDVGRITTGKISLRREPLNFNEVVLRSVEACRPLIEARQHEFTLELPPEPIEMLGDDTRLVQVLQNLLTNAAKYTSPGGQISLAVQVEGGTVVTTVSDNGRGIAPEALRRVFDLFVQEGANNDPGESGLGIGLTLARTLVEMHGGSIRADSEGRDKGSRFTVRLPLASVPGADSSQQDRPSASALGQRLRVLVVDDNRDSADTMGGLLRVLGQDAQVVYDGEAAMAAAERFRPELVLLDLNMPGTNGFGVMQRLRNLPQAPAMRVVAMTGYGQEADKARTLEAGFEAHLTKPVGVEQLRGLLEPG